MWSQSDPNHYAFATITLVNATTNPITFSGISPMVAAAGGVSQDIYLNAKNFLNTTRIFFTPPGSNDWLADRFRKYFYDSNQCTILRA